MESIQVRVNRILESMKPLHTNLGVQVSLEEVDMDSLYNYDKILSLFGEGTEKSKKFLDGYFSDNDINQQVNLKQLGKEIQYVVKYHVDFKEPNDRYITTPEELKQIRQPLCYCYGQLFKDRPTFNKLLDIEEYEFEVYLRPDLITAKLATGDAFKIIPNLLSGDKPIERLRHILATLKMANLSIGKQATAIGKFYNIALDAFEKNQTLTDVDLMLNKPTLRLNGAVLNMNMTQAISAAWGLTSPTANYDVMATNLTVVLDDILSEFKPSKGDEPALRYQLFIRNLDQEDLGKIIIDILREIRELNDTIPQAIKQLETTHERLLACGKEMQDNHQYVAQLSKLLYLVATSIFDVYSNCTLIITNIEALYLSVGNLKQRFVNYRKSLETYIRTRSKR